MNSKEIIERTINFDCPDRLGIDNYMLEKHDSDIFQAYIDISKFLSEKRIDGGLECWEDEWGNTWARVVGDKTTKGEVLRGALDDWKNFDSLNIPDLANEKLYKGICSDFEKNCHKYKLGCLPGFCFSIARKIRGLENFLVDIKLNREKVEQLLNRVEILIHRMVLQYANAGADGVFFAEDWGTQNQLLIHPNDWVEIFKPYFVRLYQLAQDNNLTVWMHSCGYIYEIIEPLIETGIKVLQLDQPELMGIERLGKEFAGRVTFWSPCDVQKVLPTGDKKKIENSIRRMCENWFVNGGGFIAKSYGSSPDDLLSIGVKEQWNDFAYDCFLKYGRKVCK